MISMKKYIALFAASMLFASMTVSASEPDSEVPSYLEDGFINSADQQAAQERGMSAGEYYNNVIMSTPGVMVAMPVGQGGKIMINGVPTDLTASLSKAAMGAAVSANGQASAVGGRLLNVVKVEFPGLNYHVATINFYLKGLTDGTKVTARQLNGDEWTDVEVLEVRADHVVLNLKNSGPVAFIEVP